MIKLLHLKVINGWSNESFDMLLELLKDALPDDETLPNFHYEARKVMWDMGLGYVIIHVCMNDCILFWKGHESDEQYPICGQCRYKYEQHRCKKKIPEKVLRYFPLTPRLRRLYMSRKMTANMRRYKR